MKSPFSDDLYMTIGLRRPFLLTPHTPSTITPCPRKAGGSGVISVLGAFAARWGVLVGHISSCGNSFLHFHFPLFDNQRSDGV